MVWLEWCTLRGFRGFGGFEVAGVWVLRVLGFMVVVFGGLVLVCAACSGGLGIVWFACGFRAGVGLV